MAMRLMHRLLGPRCGILVNDYLEPGDVLYFGVSLNPPKEGPFTPFKTAGSFGFQVGCDFKQFYIHPYLYLGKMNPF